MRSVDDVPLIVSSFRPVALARKRALVDRVRRYLTEHPEGRVRLGRIGRAVGASPGHLAEVFREIAGVSPYRYQLQMRLARAQGLLLERDDLARLALDLGFSSHSHFTTAFRRRFGETPAHFRARMRKERAARAREYDPGPTLS
jgi:AraC-like DNA-binding protein